MFRFKFATILNYRRQIEHMHQQELARVIQEWQDEKARLEEYQKLWRTCLQQWRCAQEDTVSVQDIELYQRYMVRLREEIRIQMEKVRHCIEVMNEKRSRLLKARTDRKTLEKLNDYEYAKYRAERIRSEARFNDEIATQRHGRGKDYL